MYSHYQIANNLSKLNSNKFCIVELFFGTKIVIQGDKISPEESALIIMNHRCRLDWMFYWMVLLRNGKLNHEKIILRDDLKLVPGPGMNHYPFFGTIYLDAKFGNLNFSKAFHSNLKLVSCF